jgi:hypothetical protein
MCGFKFALVVDPRSVTSVDVNHEQRTSNQHIEPNVNTNGEASP